jgi:hypothetical protein
MKALIELASLSRSKYTIPIAVQNIGYEDHSAMKFDEIMGICRADISKRLHVVI